MAGGERPDVVIEHPNRDRAGAKATKLTVILLLVVSVALMLFVTVGGWSVMGGAKPLLVGFMAAYLLLAYYVGRWKRGTLPVAAALATMMLIFAAIAGPEWLGRDKSGFTDPAVDSGLLGLVTLLIVPVSLLLIAFAMRGFTQDWHVEIERPRASHAPTPA